MGACATCRSNARFTDLDFTSRVNVRHSVLWSGALGRPTAARRSEPSMTLRLRSGPPRRLGSSSWRSAKPADCRVGTAVLRQDAKVAKSAKKGREKQRLLPWRFLASLGAMRPQPVVGVDLPPATLAESPLLLVLAQGQAGDQPRLGKRLRAKLVRVVGEQLSAQFDRRLHDGHGRFAGDHPAACKASGGRKLATETRRHGEARWGIRGDESDVPTRPDSARPPASVQVVRLIDGPLILRVSVPPWFQVFCLLPYPLPPLICTPVPPGPGRTGSARPPNRSRPVVPGRPDPLATGSSCTAAS